VEVVTHPLWRIRLTRELPRYLMCGLSVAGLAASARFAIAPPGSVLIKPASKEQTSVDRAAEGYAALFARRYLTWDAASPQASQQALEAFAGTGMEADGGLQLPSVGEQRVEWVEVVQAREPARGEHVYTLAVQTDTAGLRYLTVSVARKSNGVLALAGYPAFVGAPATGSAPAQGHQREVDDPLLVTVVERALRNYLAGSESELAADLTVGAHVALPQPGLSLESVQRLTWAAGADTVLAVVQARDGRGVRYTLAYELDVARAQGRWEISAVQTDPTAE
jgi:Conjugative transposon protein TcpC